MRGDSLADSAEREGSMDMSLSIVALSTAEVTLRALLVTTLAFGAIFVLARRPDVERFLRRQPQRVHPIYVRVDQRPGRGYQPPPPLRRGISALALLVAAVSVGAVVAFAIAVILSTLVTSVTDLLR
jgi:hypothetical protein